MKTESFTGKFDFLKITGLGKKRKPRCDPKYATFNRRMLAATFDSTVLMLLAPFFNWLIPIHTQAIQHYVLDREDPHATFHLMMYVLTNDEFMASWFSNLGAQIVFMCAFSAICWHFWSATPGKMLMRIKIVDAKTDGRINDQQVLLRSAGYIISGLLFMLGFLWIGIDKRRRGWHDILAGTAVVVVPWRKVATPPATSAPIVPTATPEPTQDAEQL